MKSVCLFFLLALLLLPARAQTADGFYVRSGDRVVFYGDSITEQRLYTTFVETYIVTRFPQMDVTFVHSGWGGDRVTGGGGGNIETRLQRDVFAYKPTVMTVMLGMNDASYRAFDQKIFETYAGGYEKIVKMAKNAAPGIRMTLIQPSPYDDVTQPPKFEGGYNAVLLRYSDFIRELAKREKLDLADLNTSVVAALKKANEMDAVTAQKIIPDRVHPGAAGHLLMAEALLRDWQAPALVSTVELSAATASIVRADNTQVSSLKSENNALVWMQADKALPLPLDMKDATLAMAVRSSDVVKNLNQQTLRVTGLRADSYVLKIDGAEIGTFTRDQLAAGINLATMNTPMMKQAMQVHQLTLRHNSLHFARWRQVQVPFEKEMTPQAQKAMQALDELESDVVRQQRAAAQPKPHRYELTAQ